MNLARQVMDQIATHGEVTRSYLGVTIQEVTPALAKAMGLNSPEGALVSDVQADTPGQKAGLKSGDIILEEVNGKKIVESNQLRMDISLMEPGQSVKLKVFRDGKTIDVAANVGAMPGEKLAQAGKDSGSGDKSMLGITVEDLTSQDARQLGLPGSTKGAVVTDVDPDSKAAEAGLRKGDVIEQVNHKPVASAQDFAGARAGIER